MLNRRHFLQATAATAALIGPSRVYGASLQQRLSQDDLLRFAPVGQVTLLHFTDIHAQLTPVYFREPSWNVGVGETRGLVPHLTGPAFLKHYGIAAGTPEAYAL